MRVKGMRHFMVLMATLPFAMQEEVTIGRCGCAVFTVPEKESIIEHMLDFNVTCDQEGTDKCQQLCVALAESVQDKAPMFICEKLNAHVENLKVAVYMKSCDMAFWTHTGFESKQPICCHEGKATACD